MDSLNRLTDRFMWLISPLTILTGLLLGDRISSLSFLSRYVFMLLTFSGAVGMRIGDFTGVFRKPRPLITFLVFCKVLIPLSLAYIVKLVLPGNESAVLGFALVIAGPVAVSSFIWTAVYGGNGALTLSIVMLDSLITPLTMPLFTHLVAGTAVEGGTSDLIGSLVLLVIVPMVIGVGANELSKGAIKKKFGSGFRLMGKAALVIALILGTSKVSTSAAALRPSDWKLAACALGTICVSVLASYLVSRLFGLPTDEVASLTTAGGTKNNTASLVLATSLFSPQCAVPVVLVILLQSPVLSTLGRLLFPEKKTAADPAIEQEAEKE
ncbi:MAG: bile acid:sodium symporter [Spirochaetales bacterium]|nr:bile acid:sodium symporter [Spirochaetales bacterium]